MRTWGDQHQALTFGGEMAEVEVPNMRARARAPRCSQRISAAGLPDVAGSQASRSAHTRRRGRSLKAHRITCLQGLADVRFDSGHHQREMLASLRAGNRHHQLFVKSEASGGIAPAVSSRPGCGGIALPRAGPLTPLGSCRTLSGGSQSSGSRPRDLGGVGGPEWHGATQTPQRGDSSSAHVLWATHR